MKECARCQKSKLIDEFRHIKDGRSFSYCKECEKVIKREWYLANKNDAKYKAKKWQIKNSDKQKSNQKLWQQNNKNKIRAIALRHNFGLSLEEYNALLKRQDNKCAICAIDQSETNKTFCVDHCHSTGKIRGLLCQSCNKMLGFAKDRKNVLSSAILYLERALSWNLRN